VIFRYLNQRYTLHILKRYFTEERAKQLMLTANDREATEWQAAYSLFSKFRRRIFGISSKDIPALRAIQADIQAVLSESQQSTEKISPSPNEYDNRKS